ncbi:hypothetical protein OK016_26930 [Vibrio chagasii]|nr:hypothetical protein [Vibrio chagasii]
MATVSSVVFAAIGFRSLSIGCRRRFLISARNQRSPLRVLCIAILGVGISGISYLIYIYAMERVGVDGTGMALNLMPLSSLYSLFLLSESEMIAPMQCDAS